MTYSEDLIYGSKDLVNAVASTSTSAKLIRKDSGAAKCKSKFKPVWGKNSKYPFITEVKNDKYNLKARCKT